MNIVATFDDIVDLKVYLEGVMDKTFRVPMQFPEDLDEAPEVDISYDDVLYVARRTFASNLFLVAFEDKGAVFFAVSDM